MAGFRARLTSLHPIWSLVLIVAVIVAGITAPALQTPRLYVAVTMAAVLLSLLWAHGIFDLAEKRDPGSPRTRWRSQLFAGTEISLICITGLMLVIDPVTLQATTGGLPALVVFPYFFCLWLAAASLVRAEGRAQGWSGAMLKRSTKNPVGAFLLMVYWGVGAWFIQPRVARLKKAATAA